MDLLSGIVLDMLSYSREREPLYRACACGRMCRDVAALLEAQAAEKGVALVVDGEAGEVCIDEAGIKRCLMNLVGNAIDACDAGGGQVRIALGPAEEDGCFAITVRDNGCGIEREALEKLFAPFYSTKGGKGTGLGLAVTKKIVEEHGGRVEVASEPGKGTAFTLILPERPAADVP
jgi:signal transduction histidine kinase